MWHQLIEPYEPIQQDSAGPQRISDALPRTRQTSGRTIRGETWNHLVARQVRTSHGDACFQFSSRTPAARSQGQQRASRPIINRRDHLPFPLRLGQTAGKGRLSHHVVGHFGHVVGNRFARTGNHSPPSEATSNRRATVSVIEWRPLDIGRRNVINRAIPLGINETEDPVRWRGSLHSVATPHYLEPVRALGDTLF
jgi:hypothetical protein